MFDISSLMGSGGSGGSAQSGQTSAGAGDFTNMNPQQRMMIAQMLMNMKGQPAAIPMQGQLPAMQQMPQSRGVIPMGGGGVVGG